MTKKKKDRSRAERFTWNAGDFEIVDEEDKNTKIDVDKMTPTEKLWYDQLIAKYNPHHDAKGLFAPKDGAASVNSKAFKKWFKNSVIVDDDGKPLKMYHGSTEEFDSFSKDHIKAGETDAVFNGFWFSSREDEASPSFRNAKNVKEFYLSVQNPAPHQEYNKAYEEAKAMDRDEYDKYGARSYPDMTRIILQQKGYDGVIYSDKPDIDWDKYEKTGEATYTTVRGNGYTIKNNDGYIELHRGIGKYTEMLTDYSDKEDFYDLNGTKTVIVFEPNQIKSTSNSGAFDENETNVNKAKSFSEIAKYNPYHDSKGKFADHNGAAAFSFPKSNPKLLRNAKVPGDITVFRGRDGDRSKSTNTRAPKGSYSVPGQKPVHGPTPPKKPAKQYADHKIYTQDDLKAMSKDQLKATALDLAHARYSVPGRQNAIPYSQYMANAEKLIDGYNSRSLMANIKSMQRDIHGTKAYNAAQPPKVPKVNKPSSSTAKDLVAELQNTPKIHKQILKGESDVERRITALSANFRSGAGSKNMGTMRQNLYANDDSWNSKVFSKGDKRRLTEGTMDVMLTKIYDAQGFHAKPEKMTTSDFNKYLKTGTGKDKPQELFRFVGSEGTVKAFIDGEKHFAGSGIYGNGTYTGDSRWNRNNRRATAYGNNGIRMALKPGSKTIKLNDINKEHKDFLNDPKVDSRDKILFGTPTRYAAAKGYDAVIVPKNQNTSGNTADYFILLNRGAVVIDSGFK